MKKIFVYITVLTLFSYCFATTNQLKNVEIKPKDVILNFVSIPEVQTFILSEPPRLVIDIKNSVIDLPKREFIPEEKNEFIKSVRVNQIDENNVRVIIDLIKETKYDISVDTNVKVSFVSKVEEKKIREKKIVKKAKEKKVVPLKEKPVEEKTVVETQEVKEHEEKTEFKLPTMPVDLMFEEADITDVLQLLAIKSGVNIIYGPDVTGTITINLKQVPFDKAFESILQLKGLTYIVLAPNIIRVLTPETFQQERVNKVVYTKIFPLNYAVATEVKKHLDSILQAENRTKGNVIADARTNSLIVTETEEGLQFVEEWIRKLDTKPAQVSIEARLVDIYLSDLKEIGVEWFGSYTEAPSGNKIQYLKPEVELPGGISIPKDETPRTAEKLQVAVGGIQPSPEAGVLPTAGLFQFGYITDSVLLMTKLGMLVSVGKAKVLSNPKVTTMSGKTATIFAGEKIPYKTVNLVPGPAGTTVSQETWQFIDAGIKLTVTPVISPDGWITMEITPDVSIPQISAPGQPPGVKTRTTSVNVMIRNGESLAIGGLISETDMDAIRKIPLLGDLPILGYLFKYKSRQKEKTELVILITPKIVEY